MNPDQNPLRVEPLEIAQYDSWRSELIDCWVYLRSQSGKVTSQEALVAVTRIIEKRLPRGLRTEGQFVLRILDSEGAHGFFWLEVISTKGFLYDVFLSENLEIEHVRNLIENVARSHGALELRVNVYSGDALLKSLTSSDKFLTINSQMWRLDAVAIATQNLVNPLTIRPMRQKEFPRYFQEQMEVYASEKVAAGKASPDEALLESREEMGRLLPDGLASEDQYIFVAELHASRVGTIWFMIVKDVEVPRAFGLYIEIDPSRRGQGLGRDLMNAAWEECRKRGVKGFALSVFGHNSNARKLYESFGFEVIEEMKKVIFTNSK